ncbi:MAG TPA: hypothetical protein VHO84_14840 [Syntrophorhabdaceae bacterium]|nr:hypothetical protein [Syntrophorhabdaceae bacterium]
MKKMFFVMLGMVLMFALVSTTFAAKSKDMSYSGQIVSVDPSSESMVVKGKDGKERTFDVSDAKWKGYKDVNELKPGDQVKLTYADKDGQMAAKRVEKSSMKTAKSGTKQKADKSSASSQQGTSSPTGGTSGGSMGSTSGTTGNTGNMNTGSSSRTNSNSTGTSK